MEFSIFKNAGLRIELSIKNDGSCRIWNPPNKETTANRRKFLEKTGIPPERLVSADLIHSAKVAPASSNDAGTIIEKVDGLLTREHDLYLSVTVADCLPIFLYDPQKSVVGILHAGWQGLHAGIIRNAFKLMSQNFGSVPSNILVGVGPSIGPCHFEIKHDLKEKFSNYPDALSERDNKMFLDLRTIVRAKLTEEGVSPINIEASQECTACIPQKYFSHRRDKSERIEAMIAVVAMTSAK